MSGEKANASASQSWNSMALSKTYLDSLPWRALSNGGGFWIYCDEAPELRNRLLRSRHGLKVGSFIYTMKVGIRRVFIHRYRLKRRSSG